MSNQQFCKSHGAGAATGSSRGPGRRVAMRHLWPILILGCTGTEMGRESKEAEMGGESKEAEMGGESKEAEMGGESKDRAEEFLVRMPFETDGPCGPILVGDRGRLMSVPPNGAAALVDEDVVIAEVRPAEVGVMADSHLPPNTRPFLFILPTGRPISEACKATLFSVE